MVVILFKKGYLGNNMFTEKEIKIRFKNHRAVFTQQGDLQIVNWGKERTSIDKITYVYHPLGEGFPSCLYVRGDLGDAIYRFNAGYKTLALNWVKEINIDYFASKCEASPVGRGYKIWDREKAKEDIDDWVKFKLESKSELEQHHWLEISLVRNVA